MWIALLSSGVLLGAPTLGLDARLRGEQQIGMVNTPALGYVGPDAALAVNPTLNLLVGGPRTTFTVGYSPRLFFRETGPGSDVLLLHQGRLALEHDFTRSVRWETDATITAGSLDYTDSDVLAPGGVTDPVQAGAPSTPLLDLTGATVGTRLSIRASRRWLWTSNAYGGYLGYAGLAGDGPSMYWGGGRIEGRYAWSRRCSIGVEPGGRQDQFIDGPGYVTASLPMNLRCDVGWGDLRTTAGVAAVVGPQEPDAPPDTLRWFPLLGLAYEGWLIDRRCTVGSELGAAPLRDPMRQNVGARTFWGVMGTCRFDDIGVRLRARMSMPVPLQLSDNPMEQPQDQALMSRLSVAYLGWDAIMVESGLRATGRNPPDGLATWDLGMFLAVSYRDDFSLGNMSWVD